MTGSQNTSRAAWPRWSAEEDASLLEKLKDGPGNTTEFWIKFAEEFPGRTFYAVRQRYLTLRMRAAGKTREPHPRSHRAKKIAANRPARERMREPSEIVVPAYTNLTAAIFGDPRPGRSALDRRTS